MSDDDEPDERPPTRLEAAVEAYRDRFGIAPNVWSYIGCPAALARELTAAVARGEPLSSEELGRRLGFAPLPPGAIE